MIVANIVSQNKITISNDFNMVKTMDGIIHGLPTLIVGFDQVMKLYPDFDILNNKLGYNLYWTFKGSERRDEYQSGLSWFINHVYKNMIIDVKYVFVDPIQFFDKTLIKTIKKIYSLENKITFIYNDMIYVYGEKLIFGIDLKLIKYMGCDVDKIKTKIIARSYEVLDTELVMEEFKNIIPELGYQIKYLPYLCSLKK